MLSPLAGSLSPLGTSKRRGIPPTAYWPLDEASAPLLDSIGSNDLSAPNGFSSVAGVTGNAVRLTKASGQYLGAPADAAFQSGSDGFTLGGWVWLVDGTLGCIACRDSIAGLGGDAREWGVFVGAGEAYMEVFTSGGNRNGSVVAAALVTGQWLRFFFWYDVAATTVNLQVDTSVYSLAPNPAMTMPNFGTAPLLFGRREEVNLLDCRLDELKFHQRLLTAAERGL